VFVTGFSPSRRTGDDYATVAYGAATGRRLWVSRYDGPANGDDFAHSVTVSPGGGRVQLLRSRRTRVFGVKSSTTGPAAS
jgi:hypothetical protein